MGFVSIDDTHHYWNQQLTYYSHPTFGQIYALNFLYEYKCARVDNSFTQST